MSALRTLFCDYLGPMFDRIVKQGGAPDASLLWKELLATVQEGEFTDATDAIWQNPSAGVFDLAAAPPESIPFQLPFPRTAYAFAALDELYLLSATELSIEEAWQDIEQNDIQGYRISKDLQNEATGTIYKDELSRAFRVSVWLTGPGITKSYGYRALLYGHGYIMTDPQGHNVSIYWNEQVKQDDHQLVHYFVVLCRLWAVKNVTRLSGCDILFARQQRRRIERAGISVPSVRHHTLYVTVPTSTRDRDGASVEKGACLPLHRVRGHFADYTQNGLFGRLYGVFWVPAHFRGDAEEGLVTKDYSVTVGSGMAT